MKSYSVCVCDVCGHVGECVSMHMDAEARENAGQRPLSLTILPTRQVSLNWKLAV